MADEVNEAAEVYNIRAVRVVFLTPGYVKKHGGTLPRHFTTVQEVWKARVVVWPRLAQLTERWRKTILLARMLL